MDAGSLLRCRSALLSEVGHALMDGVHVGRYYALVQEYLDHPDSFLGVLKKA